MFLQIHMLQSMPPGNLNRDENGLPKKCIFGGVTRGRISSQCLKQNIRHSAQFKKAFGDVLAVRTTYLPRMVADALKELIPDVSEDELNKVKAALASKFKAEKAKGGSDEAGEDDEVQESSKSSSDVDQTGQLVFFPPPFAKEIALLLKDLRKNKIDAYKAWINGKKKDKKEYKETIQRLEKAIFEKSETLTVDIGMFGRMTTSDLVVNVDAACQVAHAIGTHETIIESDYFTAIDDKKSDFARTQTERIGAAFLGRGETETFFDAAVYYKYLNLDIDALKKHLSWQDAVAADAAGVFIRAAASANPSGKQNSFASHGIHEFILVELSETKHPITYANAFLKPVEGLNLMFESAEALRCYLDSVAGAFAPADTHRVYLTVGNASIDIKGAKRVDKLDVLIDSVVKMLKAGEA